MHHGHTQISTFSKFIFSFSKLQALMIRSCYYLMPCVKSDCISDLMKHAVSQMTNFGDFSRNFSSLRIFFFAVNGPKYSAPWVRGESPRDGKRF